MNRTKLKTKYMLKGISINQFHRIIPYKQISDFTSRKFHNRNVFNSFQLDYAEGTITEKYLGHV